MHVRLPSFVLLHLNIHMYVPVFISPLNVWMWNTMQEWVHACVCIDVRAWWTSSTVLETAVTCAWIESAERSADAREKVSHFPGYILLSETILKGRIWLNPDRPINQTYLVEIIKKAEIFKIMAISARKVETAYRSHMLELIVTGIPLR